MEGDKKEHGDDTPALYEGDKGGRVITVRNGCSVFPRASVVAVELMEFAVGAEGTEEAGVVDGEGDRDAHTVGQGGMVGTGRHGDVLLVEIADDFLTLEHADHDEVGLGGIDALADGEFLEGQDDFAAFVDELTHPFVDVEAMLDEALGIVGTEGRDGMGHAHELEVFDDVGVGHDNGHADGCGGPGMGEGADDEDVGVAVEEHDGRLLGGELDVALVDDDDAAEEVGEGCDVVDAEEIAGGGVGVAEEDDLRVHPHVFNDGVDVEAEIVGTEAHFAASDSVEVGAFGIDAARGTEGDDFVTTGFAEDADGEVDGFFRAVAEIAAAGRNAFVTAPLGFEAEQGGVGIAVLGGVEGAFVGMESQIASLDASGDVVVGVGTDVLAHESFNGLAFGCGVGHCLGVVWGMNSGWGNGIDVQTTHLEQPCLLGLRFAPSGLSNWKVKEREKQARTLSRTGRKDNKEDK